MKAYKANTIQWTQENGYETTSNIVVGKLYRNPVEDEPWSIAWELEESTGGLAVKQYMVDKNTVEAVEVKKTTDYKEISFWFEEVGK